MKKLLILIPSYNEEETILDVIESIPRKIPGINKIDVLIVNDGSTDKTINKLFKKKVIVISHIMNCGLGVSLQTGFFYAIEKGYDYVITCDADGQHTKRDIFRMGKVLAKDTADVLIGSRLINPKGMPLLRQVVNFVSNIITLLLFNIWTTDSQSGLRGFKRSALLQIKIRSQRMEVSSEIFKEVYRLKLRIKEVPISSIYTNYSLTKGQKISNAPQVFWKLILQQFNY